MTFQICILKDRYDVYVWDKIISLLMIIDPRKKNVVVYLMWQPS